MKLKERLENETDIFGQRQPDLSTFIQLEIKEYHDTHDSARNRRIRVAGNKLNLDHFVHRHHENPQTSLSTSSTPSFNPQHDYDNGNNDEVYQCIHNHLTLIMGAPGSGKSTFARCLTMALCDNVVQSQGQDVPFLASSKTDREFFKEL